MYQIDIANSQDTVEIDEQVSADVVRKTLEAECVSAASISVAFVDNATIHELNRQYLNHDYETDVLSFLLDCTLDSADIPVFDGVGELPRGAGKRLEGEVIVSTEMAASLAEEFRWSAGDEIVLYLVHGLLHLCGYDDLTPEERIIMRSRERKILALWGLQPHYADSTSADTDTLANTSAADAGVVDARATDARTTETVAAKTAAAADDDPKPTDGVSGASS